MTDLKAIRTTKVKPNKVKRKKQPRDWKKFFRRSRVVSYSRPVRPVGQRGARQKESSGPEPRDWSGLFSRVFRFGLALGTASLVLIGGFFGGKLLFESGYFGVERILVENVQRVSRDDILTLSDVHTGMNLLDLDLRMIGKKLEENPWVARAEVQRVLPRDLVIRIKEREPRAVINLGYLYYLDDEGAIFKVLEPQDSLDFPVVTGLERQFLIDNPEAARDLLKQAALLLAGMQNRETFNLKDVSELNISLTGELTLFTCNGGVQILLGRGHFEEKIDRLELIYPDLKKQLMTLKYIDLNVADRVIVKVDNRLTHNG